MMRFRLPSSAEPEQAPVKAPSCGSLARGTDVVRVPESPLTAIEAGQGAVGVLDGVIDGVGPGVRVIDGVGPGVSVLDGDGVTGPDTEAVDDGEIPND